MANVVVVVMVLALLGLALTMLRRHRHGIVAERGMSVGADLAALADQRHVRITDVTAAGPDQVRLCLKPGDSTQPALEFLVDLRSDEFGYDLLQEWQREGTPVALVVPAGSHLLRLRSIDDLQPLTLRRVVDG